MSKSVRWTEEQLREYQQRQEPGYRIEQPKESKARPKVYDNPEGRIVDAICTYLLIQGFVTIRINSGEAKTNDRYIRFYIIKNYKDGEHSSSGIPDIIAHQNNFWIQIEVKTPKGRQTDAQKKYQELSESHGTNYYICRSLDDAINLLTSVNKIWQIGKKQQAYAV